MAARKRKRKLRDELREDLRADYDRLARRQRREFDRACRWIDEAGGLGPLPERWFKPAVPTAPASDPAKTTAGEGLAPSAGASQASAGTPADREGPTDWPETDVPWMSP
jgi:hypothetical protein